MFINCNLNEHVAVAIDYMYLLSCTIQNYHVVSLFFLGERQVHSICNIVCQTCYCSLLHVVERKMLSSVRLVSGCGLIQIKRLWFFNF